MDARARFVDELAGKISSRLGDGVLRVAISGVDGAGKTHLADELARLLERSGVGVIRASLDGFHNPKATRYRRGRHSPEGYFRDSFDLTRLRSELLDPLAKGGSGTFRAAVFDYRTDEPVDAPVRKASVPSVLLVDGVFLIRPELAGCWDLTIWLEVPFERAFERLAARDGSNPDPEAPENARYRDGQRLYVAACRPRQSADIVVDYADLAAPGLLGG